MNGPSSDLRARVLAAASVTPAPTRDERSTQVARGLALMLAIMAALAVVLGGVVRGERSAALIGFTSGLGLVLALGLTSLAAPRSLLGRPRGVLMVVLLATAPALALVPLVADLLWPVASSVRSGVHLACAGLSVVEGAVPLAFFLWLRAGTDPVHPTLTGAAFGATAGAWSAMLAYLRCPDAELLHCVVAHGVLPALVLLAVGALAGGRFLRVRRSG